MVRPVFTGNVIRVHGKGYTEENMARYGRPVLSDEIARRKRIVTFVTEAEDQKLKALANERLISVSALCHRLIVQALEQQLQSSGNRQEDKIIG